jgi:hypothetical protein
MWEALFTVALAALSASALLPSCWGQSPGQLTELRRANRQTLDKWDRYLHLPGH